jgi:hypothetical protein
MPAATAADVPEMDRAVSEVRANYAAALADAQHLRGWGGLLATTQQLAAAKAIEDLGPIIERWSSTMYRNALSGKNSEGGDYGAQRFLEFGRQDIASAIKLYRGGVWEGSLFAVVAATVKETASDVRTVVDPTRWSAPVKVLAVCAVGVVVLVMVAPYVRAVQKVVKP